MAVTAVSLTTLPCPYCRQTVDERDSAVRESIRHGVDCLDLQCGACGKEFTHYRQLTRATATEPAARHALIAAAAAGKKGTIPQTSASEWLLAIVIAAGMEFLCRSFSPQTFLVVFAGLGLGCYVSSVGQGLARRLLGLGCFELAGVLRLHHAYSHGHHNVGLLLIMMLVGALMLLTDWDSGVVQSSRLVFNTRDSFNDSYYHHHYWGGCGGGSYLSGGWFGSGGAGSNSSGSGGGGGGCGGCGS